ncbi:Isochorismatase hydrolase [Trametes coccinea BRFM310]|uniref:Isochorismatase hydrolase n=1 Tax=Trametes coccinea (strain BRFM310) TaxID=1353009 RepID=A0A1Y2I707_TRAC3|nr:Isochorismatase hydrolase [Trametes coccinea BRFM310]
MALSNGTHSSPNGTHPPSDDPKRVLILLDVQVSMLAPPPLGVPSSSTVGPNIAAILAHARASHPPPRIVHVRNCGDAGEPDEPGAPGWQLVHAPLPGEFVVDKRKNNAFAGTDLGDIVPPTAEIVMVGMQSDFCIRATCSAALARGNEVLLVRGAHATYDRVEILDHGIITPASVVESEIEGELEEAGVVLLEMKDLPGLFTDS